MNKKTNPDSGQTNPDREIQKPPPSIFAASQGQLLGYALREFEYWRADQRFTSVSSAHLEEFRGEWMG